MTLARIAFLAALTGAVLMNAASAQTHVTLATATPGGGFPFFGDNAAAVINETDKTLAGRDQEHQGQRREHRPARTRARSTSRWSRASRPTRRSRASAARKTTALVIQAIYSNPGMFAVRGDSPAKPLQRPDRQADRLGHARLGADAARPLRHRRARPRPREGFPAALSGEGRRRPGDGGRRPRRGAVGRRHRLAGLHRDHAGRRSLHRADARRGREGHAPSTIS